MNIKELPLKIRVFLSQFWFYTLHPKFLAKEEHKKGIMFGIFTALFLFIGSGVFAVWWSLRPTNFLEPSLTVAAITPEVLGEEASGSAELEISDSKSQDQISTSPSDGGSTSTTEEEPVVEESEANSPSTVNFTNRINFPVNKFGVHAFAGTDQVELAAQLVNSNGGDWGWVTFTMNINHPDAPFWNGVFAKCREKHIIPIIQLSNDGAIPSDEQLNNMANFLHSLDWPTRLRCVSVFNEVNASEYWGWQINPESYAQTLDKIIDLLRGKNGDFFIMNGAFNASARGGRVTTDLGVTTDYLSEDTFLQRMNAAVPGIFAKLDGWASHCYPHPAYTSHPLATATPTLRDGMSSYKWELSLLANNFGINNIPVFITETGWPHEEGSKFHAEWHDQNTVAEYYKIAMRDLYGPDGRVVAVAPFILKYDGYDNFAFVKPNGEKYPQWQAIVSLPKTAGQQP